MTSGVVSPGILPLGVSSRSLKNEVTRGPYKWGEISTVRPIYKTILFQGQFHLISKMNTLFSGWNSTPSETHLQNTWFTKGHIFQGRFYSIYNDRRCSPLKLFGLVATIRLPFRPMVPWKADMWHVRGHRGFFHKKHMQQNHVHVFFLMVTNGNFRVLMVALLGKYSMFSWILSHTIHGTGIFTYI